METISPALLNLLLNASWQIAVIAVGAEVSTRLLRSSARERHRIWVSALLLSIGLPLFQMTRPLPFQFQHRAAALETAVGTQDLPVFAVQYASAAAAGTPARRQNGAVSQRVATLLVGLYLAIVLLRAAALVRAWRSTRRLVRSAREVDTQGAFARVIARCLKLTKTNRVRVLASNAVASPLTLGFAPPIIVVPEPLLRENDEALLTSAIGHELVHIGRNDYLLNLIYRLIAVPLSFHPAAWFIQRRIEQTRELRCDEVVTERLLSPTAYARSLVELAGQAMRPAATMAVGIADADILEERIMFMLKKPKLSAAKRVTLLSAAALVFAAPCIAAAPYALHISVQQTEAAAATPVTAAQVEYTPAVPQTSDPAQGEQKTEQRRSADFENGRRAGMLYKTRGFAYAPGSQEAGEQQAKRSREEREMSPEEREAHMVRLQAELAIRGKYLAELSKAAKVTMQQAIDIATREVPGKVFESSLVGQRRMMVKQPDGTVSENTFGDANPQYRIVILAGDENNPERHIVFVDAVAGNVVRSVVE